MRKLITLFIAILFTHQTVKADELSENKTFKLNNGASVSGEVVKEAEDAYFVDLGDQILRLARTKIASILESKQRNSNATIQPILLTNDENLLPYQKISAGKTLKTKEMLDRVKDSVVVVSNSKGTGSGFFIDYEGRLVTNNHVIGNEKLQKVTIIRKNGLQTKRTLIEDVEVLAHSSLMDIALLKLPEDSLKELTINPLPIFKGESLNEGDQLWAVGNPGVGFKILEHTVSDGIVSSPNRNFNDILYVQTTASINPGNSGGPLVNKNGEVIGLVTFRASFQEGIAFALPAPYIHHFLKNEKAFAYDKNNPNSGYRYLKPEYGN